MEKNTKMRNSVSSLIINRWRLLPKFYISILALLILSTTVVAQQERVVRGTVVDEKNIPITGVSVIIKGTATGTQTNVDGKFSLRVSEANQILVLSFLGMVNTEVSVSGKTEVTVTMKDNLSQLNEVVVVGYGTQRKETVVGAVVQATAKQLERTGGVSNVASALTGSLPGLITSASSGVPGEENPQIVIRGNNTWNGGGPLILVDGVERPEFFNQMDISSVESISVLKDASATAVFGSRGANGVIIITTKRGKEGRAEVTGRFSTTVKTASQLPGKYDAYDAIGVRNLAIERELSSNPNGWGLYIPEGIRDKYRSPASLEEAERYPNIDWQDILFKESAMAYNANVGVRGGTDFTKYFASLDYQNEGDLMRDYDNNRGYDSGYDFNRINLRSNLDFQLTPSTVFKVDLGGTYGVRKTPWGGGNDATFWSAAYNNAPDAFAPIYQDGFFGYPGSSGGGINSIRILAVSGVQYITTATIISNFVLEQKLDKIAKGLSFRATASLDNRFQEIERGVNDANNDAQQKFIDPVTGLQQFYRDFDTNSRFDYFAPTAWSVNSGTLNTVRPNASQRRLYYQGQLNYARTFNKDHNIGLMGVFSRQEDANGSEIPGYREDWVFRTTYNYKSKYLLEYNGAYNGSEKFAPEYRFAFFSSGGLGYLISEEKFMKSLTFMDQLKLRASYGEVGDDQINSRFLYTDNWAYGGATELGNVGVDNEASPYQWYRQTSLGNPFTRWETVYKYNLGTDFSFFKGLIKGSVDWFQNKREDILIGGGGRAIASYFGGNAPSANLGKVNTKGYELTLNLDHTFKSVRLWADFAFTHAKDEVLYRDDAQLLDAYQKQAGYALNQTRTHISNGYYNSWDELYASTPHNNENINRFPGGYHILDMNADGIIDNFDSAPFGFANTPQNTFNANVGAEWKGLSLFLQFYGVNNVTRDIPFQSLSGRRNIVYDEGSYWSVDNTNADSPLPRFTPGSNYLNGSRYRYDGSYFRLKNAEIAYRFSGDQVKRLGLSSLRVFANGNNLILWTKMPDDRESNFSTNNGGGSGAYPTLKRFNFGLNVTF